MYNVDRVLRLDDLQTDPESVRTRLLSDLEKVAKKLPNGLLTRLVLDAVEFHNVNLGKRGARQAARFAAKDSARRSAQQKFEEKWWQENRQFY